MIKKNETIQVLDHGYVKLIDWMGNDETIIDAARMSTKKSFISWEPYRECSKCGQAENASALERQSGSVFVLGNPNCQHDMVLKQDGDHGLLEFLWRNHHATPFEMCEMVIEVQAPIFVFREWHRHRTQSYNEMSARYTQMPNLHYVPGKDRLIAQATKNKQAASVGDKEFEDLDTALLHISEEQEAIYNLYEYMIEHGVPKEVARVNTPVARYSKMRAKTDLRNWLAFLNLRQRPNAQWEIRQFANVVGDLIRVLFPRTHQLFEEYTLFSETFSRTEMKALKALISGYGEASNLLTALSRQAGMDDRHLKTFMEKLK